MILWKITSFNGKIHYKWPCSIAMLVYQRVSDARSCLLKLDDVTGFHPNGIILSATAQPLSRRRAVEGSLPWFKGPCMVYLPTFG